MCLRVSVVLLCVCCYVWVLCLRLLSGVKFGLCGLLLFLWVGLTCWCGVVDYVIALITRGFCWFVMFDVDCAGCLVAGCCGSSDFVLVVLVWYLFVNNYFWLFAV